ncbi:hypothetical protein VKT23_000985 [Stygiomarasmius scandens]|uniref:Uncharacterized protein n=1 Tax=Marasmiellus scandens TaxID=2682957 RepID=A0ABR1K9J6_9AGAR
MDLPQFLDPLLSYLSDVLPGPAYSLLISFLSRTIALVAAFYSLWSTLLSTNPSQWDTQLVLPPLIALLSAYLALSSLYRTTSFVFRTSVWFVKWGTIFASLAALWAWFMGGGNAVGNSGIVSNLGGLVLDILNGGNVESGSDGRSKRARPKPWDSFETHRNWQYEEAQASGKEPLQIIEEIIGAAGASVKESHWWNVLQDVMKSQDQGEVQDEGRSGRSKGSTSR